MYIGEVGLDYSENEDRNKQKEAFSKVIELAEKQGLKFELDLIKPIRGLQNTMKNESILFFTKLK